MTGPDLATRQATSAFLRKVAERFPVTRAMLFGSRARGDHRRDSDADIAVFLTGNVQSFIETKLAMADVAFDVLLETGIHIQPLPIWERQWTEPEASPSWPLLDSIRREGIEL